MQVKKAILLVNLGTPDSPNTGDVRKYLREFLLDPRVIDIPTIPRYLLVNGIIAPFRAPKSAKEYKKVWTDEGSPLLLYSQRMCELLQEQLPQYSVHLAMRYQNPSMDKVMQELKEMQLEHLLVIPLFPQYASATTGSVHQRVMEIISTWQLIPKITLLDNYPAHPKLIEAFAERARKHMAEHDFDHFILSYHGLPERQLKKADKECKIGSCCDSYTQRNRLCYRAQCFETSRKLAEALHLKPEDYTVCFQSRLGNDPWIQPYTEDVIKKLAKEGKKNVLAFSPAFVADCLETTIEVGEEYKELFEEEGGEHWALVDSLNDHPLWIEALKELSLEALEPKDHKTSESLPA
ncbi:MAG: ferrochelatase [Bernardetiaceae bacterium]|nr:ferrochelatase [Bernardetiaceae bacterium]